MHEFLSNIYIKINCLLSISNKPNGKIDMQSGNTTKSQAESHHFSTLESSLLFNSSKGFFSSCILVRYEQKKDLNSEKIISNQNVKFEKNGRHLFWSNYDIKWNISIIVDPTTHRGRQFSDIPIFTRMH